ncbi:hypothetical protein Taro_009179 [Colocasia esculenta]|uniref:Uncharacterized protein n=1 Tax=Colocasia esculenta TaxID=4460 RepID=A0A843TZF8_COLES|nr:hypothetical protein [Colocasia esculenta]
MADHKPFSPFPFFALLLSSLLLCSPMGEEGRRHAHEDHGHAGPAPRLQTFVISVQQPESATFAGHEDRERWYRSFLSENAAADDVGMGERRWVYSYHEVLTGFAARLTEEEILGSLHLHSATTHSPEFIGLHTGSGLWGGGATGGRLGEGVIVGMIDSGVTLGHPSFNDDDMPPPPSRWKGSCQPPKFCNKKVIGAKTFISGSDSEKATPADDDGHGTHTASTVAGSFVKGANVLGNTYGTASGVAPHAHLAIYKVCTGNKCQASDILAGIDAALADGVDVLSISLGGTPGLFIFSDLIAVGAFRAIKKGVFVSCAAGNFGDSDTVINDAPWILTVAAGTMDRSIVASVKLGNGSIFQGQSAFQPAGFTRKLLPLVLPGANLSDTAPAFSCKPEYLVGVDVKGKIVLCKGGRGILNFDKGTAVLKAGAAAMILMNAEFQRGTTAVSAHVLPASHVSFSDGSKIIDYFRRSNNPTVSISFEGTKLGFSSPPAPEVASFSSRGGPNVMDTHILKPDVLGPGVNMLAAWHSPVGPPSVNPDSRDDAYFNMISGTSMATPHLSGVVALLKSAHPDWSPATIRSAIMTTANIRDNDGNRIIFYGSLNKTADVLAIGAGHVNASRADDPGLVYDLVPTDYIPYLCDFGFVDDTLKPGLVGELVNCSTLPRIAREQLNYPSIAVLLGKKSPTVAVNRTVTNVGEADEIYKVEVEAGGGLAVSVVPQTLRFSAVKEKQSFTVTFSKPGGATELSFEEGSLRWVSDKHIVRIHISVVIDLLE